ncbi:MAG: ABC transporter permease [Flavobacteriales bacterium]|nr:ABC transporter permease [Flavobacteriales bacterium]
MIIRIAWKNIWRQRIRSLVVIIAIAIGLWAGLFVSAFVRGMMSQKIRNVVDLELAHVQIHHPDFSEDMLARFTIPGEDSIISRISKDKRIKAWSERAMVNVMMATGNYSGGIKVTGINPEQESKITILSKHVVEGTYFDTDKRNTILISKKTAEKYHAELRSKMVLQFQDKDRNIVSAAFRVCGIYDSGNPMYDQANAFVRLEDLQRHLNIGHGIHEIGIMAVDHDLAEPLAKDYSSAFPRLDVAAWLDLSTGMRLMITAMDTYMFYIVGIILLALLFSIVNTMLMAVLERVREIGMLMAIGMTRRRVFSMIMLETVFLSLTGGPAGVLLAWSTITWYGKYGFNVPGAAYGDFGFSNTIYPSLNGGSYIDVTIMVLVMSIFAAVYPAIKALKLKPVEALRKI